LTTWTLIIWQSEWHIDSFIVLVCWTIWLERNAPVSNRQYRTAAEMACDVLEQLAVWISARFSILCCLSGNLAQVAKLLML
jgi:hypothetical protein